MRCKARRVKCDEGRPSCGKCVQTGHRCSFLAELPVLPLPPTSNSDGADSNGTPDWVISRHYRSAPAILTPICVAEEGDSLPEVDTALDERYGLLHLQLLQYFQHDYYDEMKSKHPNLKELLEIFVETAITTPYLMDELLAYAAAHKGISNQDRRQYYITESTRLQTRALTAYNSTNRDVREATCLPMFIFSSLLSHHNLFSACLIARGDFSTLLDGLTNSIEMHRGLSVIAKASWPLFPEKIQQIFISSCKRNPTLATPTSQNTYDWFEALSKRLADADLSVTSYQTLLETLRLLKDRYNSLNPDDLHDTWTAVQDWLISVPTSYILLLNQRRPEALVILAHFAVLIHHAADHWFIGDMGRRLVHLINDHLGAFYVDWLEWPNQMLV